MKPEVLLDTDDYLVINKPAGLMVHSDGRTDKTTLADWILDKYPSLQNIGESSEFENKKIPRPGIVHRLDEETSGVLILAKNQNSFEYFKNLFMNREILKQYSAFVWGNFKEKSGIVDASIGRNKNDFRKKHAGRGIRGQEKEALTNWELVASFEDEKNQSFSFLKLYPKTGRTHQLRVHMKFLQRPIVSDSLYAPTKPKSLGFFRLALHAYKISFLDQKGKKIEVIAPYPEDFQDALARYVKI